MSKTPENVCSLKRNLYRGIPFWVHVLFSVSVYDGVTGRHFDPCRGRPPVYNEFNNQREWIFYEQVCTKKTNFCSDFKNKIFSSLSG